MPGRPQLKTEGYVGSEVENLAVPPPLSSIPSSPRLLQTGNSSKLTALQKCLIFFIFIVSLFYCSTCYPEGKKILSIVPQEHSLGKFWASSKTAQLRTLAMLIEMYPDYDLYFLDRDARLLGQTGLVISQVENEPDLQKRIHFLNVSRSNLGNPLLLQYLNQEGISEQSLSSGKKILFVDTGFQASIPRKIIKMFPKYEEQIGVQMIISSPSAREHRSPFPSTRVFGTEFNPHLPESDDLPKGGQIVHQYAKLPKSEQRADFFKIDSNGTIVPSSSRYSTDDNDGEISPKKTQVYEEDLQHYLRSSSSRLLLDKLRRQWRGAHKLWVKGDKPALVRELQSWIQIKGNRGLAMAVDFMEMTHTNLMGKFTVTPEDVGIAPQELNINSARLSQHGLPLWNVTYCLNLLKQLH